MFGLQCLKRGVVAKANTRAFATAQESFWAHLKEAPLDGNHATAEAFEKVYFATKSNQIFKFLKYLSHLKQIAHAFVGSITFESKSWKRSVQG